LIGLGETEISMNLNSIARVRKVVSEIAFEEAQELTKVLEDCGTADEVENTVADFYRKKWSHLFPGNIFPTKKNYNL
jgi:phosphoenolpyruvate-protein kinase (PTS system EI component)